MLGIFGFLLDWLITRDWRGAAWLLVPAVPAVSLIALSVKGATLNKEQLASRYVTLGEEELGDVRADWAFQGASAADGAAEDEVAVSRFTEALFRRAQELQSNNPRTSFVIGAVMGQRGAVAQAVALMQLLAPDNREGYAPAHAWIANLMLSRPISEEQMPILKHHVNFGVKWAYAPASVLAAATRFALEEKDQSRAIELLSQSAEKQPEFEGELFRLALSLKNSRVAEQTADKALPRLLSLIDEGKATANDRIFLADIYFDRKDYEAARLALEAGLEQEGVSEDDRKKLSRALSEMYRLVYSRSWDASAGSWSADIKMLDRALRADPTNPMIAEEVAKLARIGGESPPDALLKQLQEYLAKGAATPITHAWLAEAYILRQDYSRAITHLKNVVQRMPDGAHSHNNLAYALALQSPDRLEEALEHAQLAVQTDPSVADFHDTLGFVLSKLNRLNEAALELEIAIELSPGRVDFHERLADVYEKLGAKELAAAHRHIIQQLNFQNSKSQAGKLNEAPPSDQPDAEKQLEQ